MTELERAIRAEIALGGPMPFSRFMSLALYHPALGYYRRPHDPFGIAGDFYTNAQLQPVFGRLIAQQIRDWRKLLGEPADFTVVELGAGRGETGREIRACLPEVRYVDVEAGAGNLPDRITGVIFSNEFFDALPVHVVRCGNPSRDRAGEVAPALSERFVGIASDRLAWVEAEPSTPLLGDYLERFVPSPGPGQIVEVNLEALEWMKRIAYSLERGFVLTVDYGYAAGELTAGRRFPEGSLMSYFRHAAYEDVLREPGERDITAHVNFSALIEHGQSLGLQALPPGASPSKAWPPGASLREAPCREASPGRPSPTEVSRLATQAQFLLAIGQADEFHSALAASSEIEAQRHRMLLKTLLFGMGETFRVLVQEK